MGIGIDRRDSSVLKILGGFSIGDALQTSPRARSLRLLHLLQYLSPFYCLTQYVMCVLKLQQDPIYRHFN